MKKKADTVAEPKTKESPAIEANISSADEDKAQKIIKKYAAISIASGFVPLPVVDLAALAGVQLKMLKDLASLHDVKFTDNTGKQLISSATAVLMANPAASVGASLIKVIPIVGQIVGSLAFHGYAAASTYALGQLFEKHFASGGDLLNFNPKNLRGSYNEFVAKYKAINAAKSSKEVPA